MWLSGEPAWIADAPTDANFPRARAAAAAGLRAAFGFPIKSGGAFLGAIEFFTDDAGSRTSACSSARRSSAARSASSSSVAPEASVRASEARKRAILDSSLDGVITIDADGSVLEFNGRPNESSATPPRRRPAARWAS